MTTALGVIEAMQPFRDSQNEPGKLHYTASGSRAGMNGSNHTRSSHNRGMIMSRSQTSASSNADEYSSSPAYPLMAGDSTSKGNKGEARNVAPNPTHRPSSSVAPSSRPSKTIDADEGKDIVIEEKRRRANGDGYTIHQYLRGRMLGKGGFAKVYLCTALDTSKQYAVKVVPKANLVKARARQKLQTEIKIHRTLKHRHICQYKHYFEDRTNCYILLELCHNQSLNEMIKRRKRLSEPEVAYFLHHVLESLQYMHDHSVIHRDLKLGNLFLDKDMEVKVGDFGLATRVEGRDEKRKTICGTPNYIAPEIIQGDKSKRGHSFEVDIWSTGVIIYTLLVGKPPYEAKDVKATYQRILANQYSFPSHIELSENAKSLVRSMLKSDPQERPSIETILRHDFFTSIPLPAFLPSHLMHRAPVWQENEFGALVCENETDSRSCSMPRPMKSRQPFTARNPNVPKPNNSSVKNNKSDQIADAQRAVQSTLAAASSSSRKQPSSSAFKIFDESEPNGPSNAFEKVGENELVQQTKALTIGSASDRSQPTAVSQTPYDLDSDIVRGIVENLDAVLTISSSRKGSYRSLIPPSLASGHGPSTWVIRYVDYTSKYGLGFLLSNGGSGVYFNDSTKAALESDGDAFQYIERKRDDNAMSPGRVETTTETFSLTKYPESLKKKVTLLTHFRNYLIDQQKKAIEENGDGGPIFAGAAKSSEGDLVYVRKWIQTKHAILFRLSDQTIQVVFYDQTEVLLTPDTRYVTYVDKNRVRSTYGLTDELVGTSAEIEKRLKYTKEIVNQLLTGRR